MIRPKWAELYAARRRQRCAASRLPELPDSFFGWIPVLYRITDEEVLESAGLDAYVVSFYADKGPLWFGRYGSPLLEICTNGSRLTSSYPSSSSPSGF